MPLQAEYYPGLRAECDYRAEQARISPARYQAFLTPRKLIGGAGTIMRWSQTPRDAPSF